MCLNKGEVDELVVFIRFGTAVADCDSAFLSSEECPNLTCHLDFEIKFRFCLY